MHKEKKRNQPEIYDERNLYEKLPNEMLAEFHYWITYNITQNIRSQEMYSELKYIEKEMDIRGITISELYRYRMMEK